MTGDGQDEVSKRVFGESRMIRVGNHISYAPVMVGNKAFQFEPIQNSLMYALQEFKGDLSKACHFIGKPLEWANDFLATRKFRAFRRARLAALAARSGRSVDWWWEMGMDGAKGYREWYEGHCAICTENNVYTLLEAEQFRQDDMNLKATCQVCLQPIVLEQKHESFTPSREQVQFWSEMGNRLVPKIERVQHEFSDENFVFETEDAT